MGKIRNSQCVPMFFFSRLSVVFLSIFLFQCISKFITLTYSVELIESIFCVLFGSQVSTSGNFELQILEISNTNSHLLSGYCCGTPLSIRSTKTTGCPQCATAFRLCLKEYQQSTVQTQPGVLNGCSFGNVTSGVIGGSSFVLSDLVAKSGSLVLPFTFRWTVSFKFILFHSSIFQINIKRSASFQSHSHTHIKLVQFLKFLKPE